MYSHDMLVTEKGGHLESAAGQYSRHRRLGFIPSLVRSVRTSKDIRIGQLQ